MHKLQADYLMPIHDSPIAKGILVVADDGTILEIAPPHTYASESVTTYEGILCPGFVNAHCHLELSHLKGVLSQKTGLVDFILPIHEVREQFTESQILLAIEQGDREMQQNGIVAVGDISNGLHTIVQKTKSQLRYHSFLEIFGLNPDWAILSLEKGAFLFDLFSEQQLAASLSPHASYSASSKLLQGIEAFNKNHKNIISIHNQETAAEEELFLHGTGELVRMYHEHKLLPDLDTFFEPPYLPVIQHVLGSFSQETKVVLIHNTYTTKEDISWAKQHMGKQLYWCFCPNANLYIENQLPDFQDFIDEKAQIVVGTDSLTSNTQLCILSELKTIQKHMPNISLPTLLQWATLNGARLFDWQDDLGSFEVGKRPGINLIKEVNVRNWRLLANSSVQKLF